MFVKEITSSEKDDFTNVDSPINGEMVESSTLSNSRRRILRKIDLRLVPLMLVTYGIQFLDKALLGYSAVHNLKETPWVSSIFYFGYLAFEYPLASLLKKFTAPAYLGFMISAWGLTVTMMNFVQSFAGFMVVRFVLGALESSVAPSFVVLTGCWYTKQEQPIRQVAWFAGTPLFGIFGGLLAYGLGEAPSPVISEWRLLFIIFGAITFAWGILFWQIFPNEPSTATFLTEDERQQATHILQCDGTSQSGSWKWYQVREALVDPKTFIFFAIGLPNTILAGGLSGFSSLLLEGFGFTAVQTQLLGIPSHIIQLTSLILGGIVATKVHGTRLYIMAASSVPAIIGTALVHTLSADNRWGRVIAVWIIYTNSASLAVSFSVISGNVAGFTKRTTVTFLLFLGYCIGNIAAPQLFRSEEAEDGYPSAIVAMLVCFCLLLVLPLVLRVLYVRENRRRDLEGAVEVRQELEGDDLTDLEMISFRYVL